MELMMYLGNDLIESIPVQSEKLSQPGYLGQFKRQLKLRHADLLQQTPDEPDFLVIDLTPRMISIQDQNWINFGAVWCE